MKKIRPDSSRMMAQLSSSNSNLPNFIKLYNKFHTTWPLAGTSNPSRLQPEMEVEKNGQDTLFCATPRVHLAWLWHRCPGPSPNNDDDGDAAAATHTPTGSWRRSGRGTAAYPRGIPVRPPSNNFRTFMAYCFRRSSSFEVKVGSLMKPWALSDWL